MEIDESDDIDDGAGVGEGAPVLAGEADDNVRAEGGVRNPRADGVDLSAVLGDVLQAREDAQPLVAWQGAELRRYRGNLYLLPPLQKTTWRPGQPFSGTPLALGPEMGSLGKAVRGKCRQMVGDL